MRLALLLLGLPLLQEGPEAEGTAPGRALRPSDDPSIREHLRAYEIPEKPFSWKLRELKRDDKVAESWLTFPSALPGGPEENHTAWAKFWQPLDGAKGRPAAVFLHWLGGRFEMLELICRRAAERGIPSLMLYLPHYGPRRAADRGEREKFLNPDLNRLAANIRQAVVDVRRAGAWLAARPDVDPERVGVVGISLGALLGSLAAGVDGRFSRCVFVIGGGDLPGIVFHGAKETADLKKAAQDQGLTLEQLRKDWKGTDPCTFASRLREEDVLMINAANDEVIPRAATLKLRDAIGKPRVKWFKGGHYSVIFRTGPILKDIVTHLKGGDAAAEKEPEK